MVTIKGKDKPDNWIVYYEVEVDGVARKYFENVDKSVPEKDLQSYMDKREEYLVKFIGSIVKSKSTDVLVHPENIDKIEDLKTAESVEDVKNWLLKYKV